MTVLTSSGKEELLTNNCPAKRPLTATLDCPTILDITFLKKLDMTSFTKKGLIAISKICGISLVKRADDRKSKKRIKRQSVEGRKRSLNGDSSDEKIKTNLPKPKWSTLKRIPKIKVTDASKGKVESVKTGKPISPRRLGNHAKPLVDEILRAAAEEMVAEPCKTCGRSEQPERFHSHPKQVGEVKLQTPSKMVTKPSYPNRPNQSKNDGKLSFPKPISTGRRYSTGHLQSESSSRLSINDLELSFHSDHEIESFKSRMMEPKTDERCKNSSPKKIPTQKKERESTRGIQERDPASSKSTCVKPTRKSCEDKLKNQEDEDLRYITGCYVCAKQMPHGQRIEHEQQCIAEWRKSNNQLPPDKRKVEPLRPDYRFTETGDVDYEGTFKSIWANHMESLVPCNQCGRTFFPDRIQKHESCCTNQRIKPRNQTPRK